MKKSFLALRGLAVASLLLLASRATAGLLDLSLSQATQSATPGSLLSFTATVSAPSTNASAVFLNGDSSNLAFPLTLNDSGFLLNFPLSLNPGQSFTGTLFTVNVPLTTATGLVLSGIFQIQGGLAADDFTVLNSVNFSVNTAAVTPPPTSAVPEPSTYGLIGALALGALVAARKKTRDEKQAVAA